MPHWPLCYHSFSLNCCRSLATWSPSFLSCQWRPDATSCIRLSSQPYVVLLGELVHWCFYHGASTEALCKDLQGIIIIFYDDYSSHSSGLLLLGVDRSFSPMFFSTFYFWFTWVTLAREVVILNCILCTLLAGACTWCQPGKNVVEIQPNVVQLPCDTQTQLLLSLNQKHLYFQILLKYCHEVVSTEINNCFSNPNLTFSPQIHLDFL